MLKKLTSLFLCICMSLICVAGRPTYKVRATEFEGSEDEYYELCKSDDLSKEDIQVCREFKEYLSEKQESLDNQIAANEQKINDLNLELDDVYTLIADVSKKIKVQQDKIDMLDADIARLEESINEKDQRIRERMYVLQSSINSNVYLEFLMGATTIDEFFSRISSIDELTEYDHDLIKGLSNDKKEVEENRAAVQDERDRLDELKAQQESLADKLATQIEEVSVEMEAAAQQSEQYKKDLTDISSSIEQALINNGGFIDGPISSSGFSQPVQWGIVTAANWAYPSGGMHLGMDIGGRINTELYAPCDGIVIYYATGCASDGGYLGNYCNGGAGNYLVMLTQMNGTTYSIRYLHMINDNYLGWTSGQLIPVTRGEVVGHLGHSGNSTGAHVHIEILNLGPIGYTEAARLFSQYGSSFGVAYTDMARCEYNSAPCREEASAMFGYSLYQEIGG